MRHKKFFLLFFCLCLISSYSFIFADDTEDVSGSIPEDLSTPASVVVDITQLLTRDDSPDPDFVQQVEVQDLQLVGMEQSIKSVSASDATGFKAVLLTVLGDYETVVTDYEYRNNNNTYMSHSIAIEQDYAWLCSAGMLAIITYCTFRIIGGLLCKR